MKDATEEELRAARPAVLPKKAIDHCLYALFKDQVHQTSDHVTPLLTYEELIGVLLLASDLCDRKIEQQFADRITRSLNEISDSLETLAEEIMEEGDAR